MTITVFMVDDHFVVRQGVKQILALFPDVEVIGEAGNGNEMFAALEQRVPDLLLLDMTLPGLSGVRLIEEVRRRWPKLPVLMLSMHRDAQVVRSALRAGANGYLTKDSEPAVFSDAIHKVAAGKRYVVPDLAAEMVFDVLDERRSRLDVLSPREREVLEMIVAGNSIVDIADKLNLSAKTVSTHKMRLMQKLNVHNNAELILAANAEGVRSQLS